MATIRGDADLVFDAGRDVKGPVRRRPSRRRPRPATPGSETRPDTRLVVLGTGRLIMNYRLAGSLVRDYDRDFMLSVLAWLADREARIGIRPKLTRRVALSLTAADVSWAFRLFVIGLPLLALAAGVWVAMRRRI